MGFWNRLFGLGGSKQEPEVSSDPVNDTASAGEGAPLRPDGADGATAKAPSASTVAASFTGPWRARPIFVSSTFRDMHAERDYLRDKVFPELEERLRARRQNLTPIDLRLGVETASLKEDHARELLVLKVCLSEIERSRPFLPVLMGDRYGWVPPGERIAAAAQEAGFEPDTLHKSVTALEIEFGILKKDPDQRRRSMFYYRSPLPYWPLPPDRLMTTQQVQDYRATHEFLTCESPRRLRLQATAAPRSTDARPATSSPKSKTLASRVAY